LRIVTWNCNGALRNKFEYLIGLDADLYVIQECENPKEVLHEKFSLWADNHLWIGDGKNKGLGIFAASNIKLSPLNWTNAFKDHTVKHFLPCLVNDDFQLLAVWTHQNNSPNFGYIGQFWKYLQVNKQNFEKIIIAGDFNSNAIWDEWDRWWSHSDVIKELDEIGIKSLYHISTAESQGKETMPTFYMHRKIHKPYHIDYIFGSKEFLNNRISINISGADEWLKISDHLPMIFEF
jgi:exonuclease III